MFQSVSTFSFYRKLLTSLNFFCAAAMNSDIAFEDADSDLDDLSTASLRTPATKRTKEQEPDSGEKPQKAKRHKPDGNKKGFKSCKSMPETAAGE